ncbi:MAG: biotin synthase BioB [Bacteroidales bacterium]|nr:biotin synthase BioB [Bacteroidales bacterium]MDD7724479.1 biotin synthase BioB [Bacteroidales bacterium]
MTTEELIALGESVKTGHNVTFYEARQAALAPDKTTLYKVADGLRKHFRGDRFQTCSIINARSGRCSEDCKWCAQSHKHHTGIDEYPLIDAKAAVDMAIHNARKGVGRFSLVTSGRRMTDSEIDHVVDIYHKVAANAEIDLCASMGLLSKPQLQKLHDAGLCHYHCNVESAPSFFPSLCTTHTIEDKLQTIRWAQEVGFKICSGGIIGMGETLDQRIEMAIFLRDDVKADSIPVNVLMPIKGTALEDRPPLSVDEILTAFAIFRLCNPKAEIRMAGGRVKFVDHQTEALACGVDASIVGDMLTTTGTGGIDDDMALFQSCGRDTEPQSDEW